MDTKGVSGERVIDSMKNRLDTILSKQGYNWIIILGGEVHTVMLSTECFQNNMLVSNTAKLQVKIFLRENRGKLSKARCLGI